MTGIAADDQLRPLFPRDLADSRSMQKLFFAEWLGGPRRYSERAHAGLGTATTACRSRRRSPAGGWGTSAGRWRPRSRRKTTATAIFAQVRSLAMALVSGQVAPASPAGGGTGVAGRTARKRVQERPAASGLVRHRRAYRDAGEGPRSPW